MKSENVMLKKKAHTFPEPKGSPLKCGRKSLSLCCSQRNLGTSSASSFFFLKSHLHSLEVNGDAELGTGSNILDVILGSVVAQLSTLPPSSLHT